MAFSAIKGQDKPIEIIKAFIKNSRFEGGYLFTGPEGVGKMMAARALAKSLNCSASLSADSCEECPSCKKIENNQHPDVHIISGEESQIKIEAIRHLQKDMSLRPYEGESKVFIIDNAHTLTPEASNCLLKILEEPPKKSLLILISDKPGLLFKTVISRCKIIKFQPLQRHELESILKKDYNLEDELAHFLAYFSEGRLGRALKLKDEDIFFRKNDVIDKFVLSANSGVEGFPAQKREDVRSLLNILATWFRDIYLLKTGSPEQDLINFDRRKELMKSLERFSFPDLDTILNNISTAISCLEQNVNTRLLLYNLKVGLWKV